MFSYHSNARRPSDEMLGHKRQHLFGSRHGFAQRNESSFSGGIIHSLAFLKALSIFLFLMHSTLL